MSEIQLLALLQRLLEVTRFEDLGHAVVDIRDFEGSVHTGTVLSEEFAELLEEVSDVLRS